MDVQESATSQAAGYRDGVVTLRRADDGDAVRFYRWWKDRETQRFTGTPRMQLSWEDHLAWFIENVRNPHWYVGMDEDGRAVGAMRLDPGEDVPIYWVSIVMDPDIRGRGYGTAMLKLLPDVGNIYARIHRFNLPSLRAFEKAGFELYQTADPFRIYRRP